jgi:4-hydroxybenzoate polyprenyltransferase
MTDTNGTVADARRGNWVDRFAPDWLKPYARLARWDRPLPLWLLFWPCGFSLALAAIARPEAGFDFYALALCAIGSILMRGAGCTYNDIADRHIDARVARTRSRPIPSGQVTAYRAFLFFGLQSALGFLVLIQFNAFTIWVGVASLVLIGIYPFMKRITFWPQLFLGFAFSYGALVGWSSQMGSLALAPLVLYAGAIAWTIGYDTIYALQDIEDDALIGVKSTARLFGERSALAVAGFYALAVVLWTLSGWLVGAGWVFMLGLVPVAAMLAWQVVTLDIRDPQSALSRFRFNNWVGLLLTAVMIADWAVR